MKTVLLLIALGVWSVAAAGEQRVHSKSSIADQRDLAVTVYNNDYGLVREVRELTLPAGTVALEFGDVAEKIDATSVALRSLTRPDGLAILEQNYRYDLLSPETLLARYVGRSLKYVNYIGEGDKVERREREGVLLSVAGGQVVRFGDAIEINPAGTISLADIPDDLLSHPTLVWLLSNKSAKAQEVEVSYLTTGMSWHADYVAVLAPNERDLDLTAWVTLDNRSGTSYRDALLKLVAGDVRRLGPAPRAMALEMRADAVRQAAQPFEEQSFFEYHLYTLDRRTTLANNETKQIVLLQGQGIGVSKRLFVESSPLVYGPMREPVETKVDVSLRFANSEKNRLGMALPAGRVRVYRADDEGSQQLIGEERIDHTPRDEMVDLTLGKAFDVVAERRQSAYRKRGERSAEVSYEVEIRNHKEENVTVTVIEELPGDWTIAEESLPHRKVSSRTVEFDVRAGAGQSARLAYTAIVSW